MTQVAGASPTNETFANFRKRLGANGGKPVGPQGATGATDRDIFEAEERENRLGKLGNETLCG
jgi:hypothetical protein